MGLYTRFTAACLAQNECVLIQDDDLEVQTDSLRALVNAWQNDPGILHGIFGRRPSHDGSYDPRNVSGGEVPIVLTRVLVAHRRYASQFFQIAPTFDDVQQDSRPFGNGEDIIFSYVVTEASGRLNRVYRLPVMELPAPHAIYARDWKAHLAHRSRLLQACEAWLAETPSVATERSANDCERCRT